MKLLLLILAPLLVAQTCLSMKKQPITLLKTYVPKPLSRNLVYEFALNCRRDWQLLEQSHQMYDAIFELGILQKQSYAQTEVLQLLQLIFDKPDAYPDGKILLQRLIDLQISQNDQITSDYNFALDAENLMATAHSGKDLELKKIIDYLKNGNAEHKKMLGENYETIISLLDNEATPELFYDPNIQRNTLNSSALCNLAEHINPEHKFHDAAYRIEMIDSMQKKNKTTLTRLKQCHTLVHNFFHKAAKNFTAILKRRIESLGEVIKETEDKRAFLVDRLKFFEHEAQKVYLARIQKLRNYLDGSGTYTLDQEQLSTYENHFENLFKKISSCSEINDKTLNRLRTLRALNKQLYELQNKPPQTELAIDATPSIAGPLLNGQIYNNGIQFHTKDTIAAALKRWKHQVAFPIDPTSFKGNLATTLYFVSNNPKCVSLETIKQKKNSKKKLEICDGIQLIDPKNLPHWIKCEHTQEKRLYHSRLHKEYYLYNAATDNKNVYIVEDILSEYI